MTILPDSLVVASDEAFSFIVPEHELAEAMVLDEIPEFAEADNPQVKLVVDSLRGVKIKETRVSARKVVNGKPCVRVMFIHNANQASTVKTGGK